VTGLAEPAVALTRAGAQTRFTDDTVRALGVAAWAPMW